MCRLVQRVEISYAPAYKDYMGMFAFWRGPEFLKNHPEISAEIDAPADPEMLAEALALAKDADLVIYYFGTNKSIETEGSDRENINLPLDQERIAEELAAVNPNIRSQPGICT